MELQEHVEALKTSNYKRVYVEACLLATPNVDEISELLQIPAEVLREYERTVFPYSHFDRLSKLELLDSIEDKQERELKLWAVTQGIDFIKWRLGFKIDISPVEGLKQLYADCIFKAKEAFFNPNSAEGSKEAMKWSNQAMWMAKLIKAWVTDSKEAIRDIEMALKEVSIDDIDVGNLDKLEKESAQMKLDLTALSESTVADGPSLDDLEKENGV